jgi:urease accessory protein
MGTGTARVTAVAEAPCTNGGCAQCVRPPLKGRIAGGNPGWGDNRAAEDSDAPYVEALSPPPGLLTQADLPPAERPPPYPPPLAAEGREGVGSATRQSDRSRQQPTSIGGGEEISSPALYRLMTWMSPAYPVGAFSYSGGLEWAVEAGDIRDACSLTGWLAAMIRHGSVFCDAAIFCHAHRAAGCGDGCALAVTAEIAAALVGSRERFLETTAQGQAFLQITQAAWPTPALDRLAAAWNGPRAYPVAAAAACAGHGIALVPALHAFLHGVVSNLVSAGVRLIPLGQTDGQRALAALEAELAQTAQRALATALDDIGSTTLRADIASMRHETQHTRLFRS